HSSTTSARSVTRTFFAAAVSTATLEVVIPCLRKYSFVLPNDIGDAVQLRLAESIVVRHPHWCKLELREFAVASDVNVEWLVSVAGEEEKPVRAALQDGRTHAPDSVSFVKLFPNRALSDPANVRLEPRAAATEQHGTVGASAPSRCWAAEFKDPTEIFAIRDGSSGYESGPCPRADKRCGRVDARTAEGLLQFSR